MHGMNSLVCTLAAAVAMNAVAAWAFGLSLTASAADPPRPNIVVFLTDDQGYADAGFQGFPASADVLTPNLDRLAGSGIVFRNGYVANATCGPSRASLLTGRNCSRFGREENDHPVPLDEILVPKALRPHGYVSGAFGKWHLGEEEGELPLDRGFDYYWGDIPREKDYFMRVLSDPPSWVDGTESPRPYGRYVTDAYTDEAVRFIKRNKANPFFAYVAYNAPHSPFRTYEALVQRVVAERPQWRAAYERMKAEGKFPAYDFGPFKGEDLDQEILRLCYVSMLLAADDGVGKILQTLEEEGLRENTLVFFLSDNGAALARPNDLGGVNLPLRHGKGTVYDGGVRVPYVMSWPGTLPAGQTSELVVTSMDIFATAVELAGGTVPQDRVIDGVNLIPFLTGEKEGPAHESLFFRRSLRNAWSIRSGDYKWVWNPAKTSDPEPHPEGGLYDIQNRIQEDEDLSGQFPEKKQHLIGLYEQLTSGLPTPGAAQGLAGERIVDFNRAGVGTQVWGRPPDAGTDRGAAWIFSETMPLVAAAAGTNNTVHGGIAATWGMQADHTPNLRFLAADALQIQVNDGSAGGRTVAAMWVWMKEDFLGGHDGQVVSFAEGGGVSIRLDNVGMNDPEFRVVVKQGGSWHVADEAKTDGGTGVYRVDLPGLRWAVINPADYGIGSYGDVVLDDVQGIGFYMKGHRDGTQQLNVQIGRFEAAISE